MYREVIENDIPFENIKEMQEYRKAVKRLKDVSKGGKYYGSCSFMDISVAHDRVDNKKKKAIKALGKILFNKITK